MKVLKSIIITVLVILAGHGLATATERDAVLERLASQSIGELRLAYRGQTDAVRTVRALNGSLWACPDDIKATASLETVAGIFLKEYSQLFGLPADRLELTLLKKSSGAQRSFVRFQQLYKGIPILGGELIVQLDGDKNVISANGEVSKDVKVNPAPSLSADKATRGALEFVAGKYGVPVNDLSNPPAKLWLYDPSLLGAGPPDRRLVWLVEIIHIGPTLIRELVLMDAMDGQIVLNIDKLDRALNRLIYDKNNDASDLTLPGTVLARSEGQEPSGIADVDNAYDYAGDTYDFYFEHHNRDSLDNAGMSLIVTVRYCEIALNCPLPNAFWTGAQAVFGEGLVCDEIVAHELTHGVTEHESNLFYYMQSGAINESFSDLWGEFVDLTNGRGLDDPEYKWAIGEGSALGVVRDMGDPTLFNSPDRMTSPFYSCGTSDNGGVHTNSGVNNKAVSLMVDGGSFNGKTVNGIGLDKTAAIYYLVQTGLLTSGSDYADLYEAANTACQALIDGPEGITAAECEQVNLALEAVEMNLDPPACPAVQAPRCRFGDPVDYYTDDLEGVSPAWVHGAIVGDDVWEIAGPPYDNTLPKYYATSGTHNLYGENTNKISDSYIMTASPFLIPKGAFLHFNHAFSFEPGAHDGGVVEYSLDEGQNWRDAGPLFLENGYNGVIGTQWGQNPLEDRDGFINSSNGYISSRINLRRLAGKNVLFRFRLGTDRWTGAKGWYLDDISLYTCPGVEGSDPLLPAKYLMLMDN